MTNPLPVRPAMNRSSIDPSSRHYFRVLVLSAAVHAFVPMGTSAEPTLLEAIARGETATWPTLLKSKADVDVRDAKGNTPLHLAALNRDLTAVRALLIAGATVDAKNQAEATPLIYGAGDAGVVTALLERGANANAVSTLRMTPLMAAVLHPNSFEVVQKLIAAGADVAATRQLESDAVLSMAITGGDRRTIDLLLERGAGNKLPAASAALNNAARHGDAGLVRLLLEHGANPNFDDEFVGHGLNNALFSDQPATARELIGHASDLNLRSRRGHGTPPIVFAAYHQDGDPTLAKALVEAGADVNAANEHGMTALSYALRSGADTPLVRYLRSVGAKAPETARTKQVPDRPVPATAEARAVLIRERMQATLDVLQLSSDAFLDNGFVQTSNCTSCHGQDLPPRAYELARARGFRIDDASLGRQIAAQTSRWVERAERGRQMLSPVPGAPVSIAYGLFGLRASGYPSDEMTGAMVRYLVRTQKADGHWNDFTRRPPMEDGTLVATGWIPLALRDYAPAGYERVAAEANARAAVWLARQTPRNNNELVFQLLGLHWAGEPANRLKPFLAGVARAQRPDGGWAQLAGLESDAWATGSALYALHESGMRPVDAVYQRGVAFLLRTQFEDGSWWVRSRAWPFQPHFNGQFPHGKDQWISQGATAWAAMALLFALEPEKTAQPPPGVAALIAKFKPTARKRANETAALAANGTVDFVRDIRPLLERSCAKCHGGEKPRAGFEVATRETLFKGGASGEPAVVPGKADASPLIQYVSGKIEDLEMPPLDRRDKYPALTAAEIELLRTWIDQGAAGSPVKTATTSAGQ